MTSTRKKTAAETVLLAQQAFKLALSVTLLYWLALWMNWDMPKYGALAIILISLDTRGASLNKGLMRVIGTTIGLGIGLFGLSMFVQDRWLNLVFHASYLAMVSYFMRASRYSYAWFVAGFMPSLVWATTYGKVENVFHYATFRYLETTAGIVIYALVSALLWPRLAGDQLNQEIRKISGTFQQLFHNFQLQIMKEKLEQKTTQLLSQLKTSTTQFQKTLEAAYMDTASVKARKHTWKLYVEQIQTLENSVLRWQQSIGDCQYLEIAQIIPRLEEYLTSVVERFRRIENMWMIHEGDTTIKHSTIGDETLQTPSSFHEQPGFEKLSQFDRIAITNFVEELKYLDHQSSELLHTTQELTRLSGKSISPSRNSPRDTKHAVHWNFSRFIEGLLPSLSFTSAYIFWILFDPPTGPSVPNMAATFGLVILLTPMNAFLLVPVLIVALWCFVAPVYFFVMPQLSSGVQLLALIFGFTFAVSMIRGRLSILKSFALILFVMMTGISNQQSYTFQALLNPAIMLFSAAVIIGVVQLLSRSRRPEQIVLDGFRTYCQKCSKLVGFFSLRTQAKKEYQNQPPKNQIDSQFTPLSGKFQSAQKHINFKQYPEGTRDNFEALVSCLQGITLRLKRLHNSHDQFSKNISASSLEEIQLIGDLYLSLQRTFQKWEKAESAEPAQLKSDSVQQSTDELAKSLDRINALHETTTEGSNVQISFGELLFVIRGLIYDMRKAQFAIDNMNWQGWAESRF